MMGKGAEIQVSKFIERARSLVFLVILISLAIASCSREEWEQHYSLNNEQVVDMYIWDAVRMEPRFSYFVELVEQNGLDTIFESGYSHTLFIPDNEALSPISDTASSIEKILSYHISNTVFQIRNVEHFRKLQTLTGKFVQISRNGSEVRYQDQLIEYDSPLYIDGKVYEIDQIAYPLPNLYEFTELFSSVIKSYIDMTDSIYLDKSLSKPIGFDDQGNTIYDTVMSRINRFEENFFPVSKEFRDRSATFILFTQDQYDHALDEMAERLGGDFQTHADIPIVWQNEILLPLMLDKSLFANSLEYTQLTDSMISIRGAPVVIDPLNVDPTSKYICSNGVAYTYLNFDIDTSLYLASRKIEGESLVDSIGDGTYAWKDGVEVAGYVVSPSRQNHIKASAGSMLNVPFPRSYNGEYTLSFNIRNVFPMRYRLEWRARNWPSGKFAIYINEEKIDEFDTFLLGKSVISVTGERFIPEDGFNSKDWWIENITSFGDVKIKFEYLESGTASSNGLIIDYIALIPEKV
jgi:uncharacterized surface protein with fasciclin (FAS1) repeats